MGRVCGSDGRAVAYGTSDPQFEFCYVQYYSVSNVLRLYRKDKNIEKKDGNVPYRIGHYKCCSKKLFCEYLDER